MINVRYLSAKLIFEQQAQAEKEIQKRALPGGNAKDITDAAVKREQEG